MATHGHELALTVLFESGLQHLADRPESFLAQPQTVKDFLGHLPTAWDETRFISGYPGEYVVLARRSGDTWYIAGINGTDVSQTLPVALPTDMGVTSKVTLFTDSGNANSPWTITEGASLPTSISCLPRGGFVVKVKR